MLERLTKREREVLSLMAQGFSDGDIARKLFISKTTVKTHLVCILDKLELSCTTPEKHVLRIRAVLIYLKENGELSGRREMLDKIYEQIANAIEQLKRG